MNQPNFKLIDQSIDRVFPFTTSIDDQLEQCQYMTRISYRYEDKETKVSPKDFVMSLIESKHYEPLEFVTIYAKRSHDPNEVMDDDFWAHFATIGSSSHVRSFIFNGYKYFIFTLREVVEWCVSRGIKFDFQSEFFQRLLKHVPSTSDFLQAADATKHKDAYIRVKWIVTTNRQIATEISRHRCLSKNWESTRHCNYSNDRFGSQLQICDPEIYRHIIYHTMTPEDSDVLDELNKLSDVYMSLSKNGNKVQAAYMLPSCTAVKVAFSGFMNDVDHVILMRTTDYCGRPHEDAISLMTELSLVISEGMEPAQKSDKETEDCVKVDNTHKAPNELTNRIMKILGNPNDDNIRNAIINEFGDDVNASRNSESELCDLLDGIKDAMSSVFSKTETNSESKLDNNSDDEINEIIKSCGIQVDDVPVGVKDAMKDILRDIKNDYESKKISRIEKDNRIEILKLTLCSYIHCKF